MTASSEPIETPRETSKREFLAEAGWGAARRVRLPGDASTRHYERLHRPDGSTAMLMDQPPSAEAEPCQPDWTAAQRAAAGYNALARLAAGRVDAFAGCANYLRGRGLSAPQVLALDVGAGLAVLEDLGDDLFATRMAAGAAPELFYEAAVDLLIGLHAERPPAELAIGPDVAPWPLLDYDQLALETASAVFADWWTAYAGGQPFDVTKRAEWSALWGPVTEAGARGASVFTHRDYHAENLIWLPGRTGSARVGLLDFQDALRAHPAWDLLSLLQDARREVPAQLEAAMLARYLAARPELDAKAFRADYAGLAALNATRILGVFARLVVRDGKPKYAAWIPRMQRMLARNLAAPSLAPLKAWFTAHAPMEALR